MKKGLFILFLLISITGFSQVKISQYTRSDSLKGNTPPYLPDSALMDVSVYNFPASYSTRAITWYNLKALVYAGDTMSLKTTGDTGWGTYTFNGNFTNNNGLNFIYNKPITGFQNFAGAAHINGTERMATGVMQKTDDTSAGLAYQNSYVTRKFAVHRNFMGGYFDVRPGKAHFFYLKWDSLMINMGNSYATIWDTTGHLFQKKNATFEDFLLSKDTIAIGNLTDSNRIYSDGNLHIDHYDGAGNFGSIINNGGWTIASYGNALSGAMQNSAAQINSNGYDFQFTKNHAGTEYRNYQYIQNNDGFLFKTSTKLTSQDLIKADSSGLQFSTNALFNDKVVLDDSLRVDKTSTFVGNMTLLGSRNMFGNASTDSTFIFAFLQDDSYSNLFFGRNAPKTYTGTNGYNLFVGKPSPSLALTTGYYNTIIGNIAGDGLTTGFSNVVVGYNALGASTATSSSVFIGQSSGSSVSSVTNSVTIGALAGQRIAGSDMVNLGFHAGLGESALTNSARSIFIGSGAGENIYAAPDDIGIGYAALPNDSATGTGFNIAIGQYTMQNKRKGNYNTVIGSKAVQTLNKNTNNIVAVGYNVLNAWNKDTLAPALCAVGTNALSVNTNAVFTAAFGASAMANSTTGGYCNAFGYATLSDYTGAYSNAFGHEAGFSWLTGNYNTLIGMYAGRMQQTGAHNNYLGYNVAGDVTTGGGSNNQYIGSEVCRYNKGSNNVVIGHQAGRGTVMSTYDGCVKLGNQAGYNDTLDNKLFIANSSGTPLIGGDFSALTLSTTANNFEHDSLQIRSESSSLADDGTITLATGQSGSGTLFIDSAGFRKILIYFSFQDDGTSWIDVSYNTGSGWTTAATSDSDGNVCIYDAGSGVVIKQRLGYRVGARLTVNYATN